jgi:hypothetical protein
MHVVGHDDEPSRKPAVTRWTPKRKADEPLKDLLGGEVATATVDANCQEEGENPGSIRPKAVEAPKTTWRKVGIVRIVRAWKVASHERHVIDRLTKIQSNNRSGVGYGRISPEPDRKDSRHSCIFRMANARCRTQGKIPEGKRPVRSPGLQGHDAFNL